MKIAIPVFQTKVSPRFDSAQGFILLHIAQDTVQNREELPTQGWPTSTKIRELIRRGVGIIICGGIDGDSMRHLRRNGLKVYSWITGEVEDAITSFLRHDLESGIILGAHGAHVERWRFREDWQ